MFKIFKSKPYTIRKLLAVLVILFGAFTMDYSQPSSIYGFLGLFALVLGFVALINFSEKSDML